MSKQLEFGETPWDNMTRQELLEEVWRMYIALQACESVVNMDKHFSDLQSPNHPYFDKEGTGGGALELARQALHQVEGYSSENVYRSFFRYARDLLFERNGYRATGTGWAICPECGVMIGENGHGETSAGKSCAEIMVGDEGCQGVLRLLQWSDLRKPSAAMGIEQIAELKKQVVYAWNIGADCACDSCGNIVHIQEASSEDKAVEMMQEYGYRIIGNNWLYCAKCAR